MGQYQLCSVCKEQKHNESDFLPSRSTNIFISQTATKSLSLMDRPIFRNFRLNHTLSFETKYITNSHIESEGFGIVCFENKSIFKGYFQESVPRGWGVYTNPTNGIFQGEYDNDAPNGYGIYEHITESLYEGYWKNEKQDGIGIEKWVDTSVYEGEFLEGKKSGIGIYIFPNNNIYMGQWSNNMMEGYGIYSYGNNNIYMGTWSNGVREGYGEVFLPKNSYFFGNFKNNIQNGFFIFYNAKNGRIIVGNSINGKVEGIIKYFKSKNEGKLILLKNGIKNMEIEDPNKIENYLDKINDNSIINIFFYMKRNEIEKIINDKINNMNIEDIYSIINDKRKKFTFFPSEK